MNVDEQQEPFQNVDNLLLLKSVPLFAELPESDVKWFLKRAKTIEFLKKNFLFQHGDPAKHLYIVTEGWIKIYHDNQNGEELIQTIATRGDTFGEESVVEGRTYPFNAQVIGRNAKCLKIPAKILRERFSDQPVVALKIISALADQLNKTSYFLELHSKLTSAQRLAAFLLKLSMDRGGIHTILLPYNKLIVAGRLEMQPETLSRAMRRLEEDLGVRFDRRKVTIPDLKAVQDYCEVYCYNCDNECPLEKKLLCKDPACDVSRMLKMM